MSKKRLNRTPPNTKIRHDLATTRSISPTSPKEPARLHDIAGQELARLFLERQGRPRTMSKHDERLFLVSAAISYSYCVKIRQQSHQLGVPVPDLPYKAMKKAYDVACDALGCEAANPLVRDA